MERRCEKCKAAIPPQQGSARPRKFCTACRPPRNRPNPRVVQLRPPAEEPSQVSAFVGAYRRELAAAGRLESPQGALVMQLAELLDAGRGAHTAAGAASLSRELRAAMAEAMADAQPEADVIDRIFGTA